MNSSKHFSKRSEYDEQIFRSALERLENPRTVSSGSVFCADKAKTNTQAVDSILDFYGIHREDLDNLDDLDIIYRKVKLTGDWWKASGDPLISRMENGEYVALIPRHLYGYCYMDANGKKRIINASNQALFESALNFCRKFPNTEITPKVYAKYIKQFISKYDVVFFVIFSILAILAGVLIPRSTSLLLDAMEVNETFAKIAITLLVMVSASVFTILGNTLVQIISKRVTQRSMYSVRNAVVMRIVETDRDTLVKEPRIKQMGTVYDFYDITEKVITLAPRVIVLIMYILAYSASAAIYMGEKVLWIVLILAIQGIIILPLNRVYRNSFSRTINSKNSELNTYGLLAEAIPKIQQMNAEKRSFVLWEKDFEAYIKNDSRKNKLSHFNSILPGLSVDLITLIIMTVAVFSKIDISDFFVLIMIAGILVSNVSELVNTTVVVSECQAMWNNTEFLRKDNHYSRREKITGIHGDIRIENVTFSYDDAFKVLDKLNLNIAENEYVAIVGPSGGGKSTLLHLMMGILYTENGSIWYGRNRMTKATRYGITRNIRFISQSDTLIPGTIRDNMEMCVKSVTDEEIWDVLEKVDMADCIRKLPFGLDTKINSGAIALSQGQIQRLVIARAIISKPKIMILDEATSALDNICQKKISDTLDAMKGTKVVVAHRLSTVKHCSRIVLLDNGKIVEEGSYEELMNRRGRFYELVKLQENKPDPN